MENCALLTYQKASLLNSYFASVGTANNDILPVWSDANVNFWTSTNISFTLSNVLKAIEKLKNNLSSGPDNILPSFYVMLSLPPSIIYQQINSVGAIPPIWNTAIIFPVFKKVDPTKKLPSYTANFLFVSVTFSIDLLLTDSRVPIYWKVYTALHWMQRALVSREMSDRPSVCLSVRLSNACIVTKHKKDLSRSFSLVVWEKNSWWGATPST